ncbi:MAG: tyrosine-type recombinase/integrase [Anaerolineales bacterium]|nr:tyrosine-type recombinase/integrase [Anaerolineales bacterium]
MKPLPTSAIVFYEGVLKNGRKSRLPPDQPQPAPPSCWPPENRALLEQYYAWLIADGAGRSCITTYYLPMAGHVLGFFTQPHPQLNLATDLEPAMTFVRAKRFGRSWEHCCQLGLNRFRRFLQQQRNFPDWQPSSPPSLDRYQTGLPSWLIEQLTHLQQQQQANWRAARQKEAITQFWSKHSRLWRWLYSHHSPQTPSDISRNQLFAYIDTRLSQKANPKTINQELRCFQATLRFLQGRGYPIPHSLLRLPGLQEPSTLPRFLTDEQVGQLQADVESRVEQASDPVAQRNALLDRALFYLLWQGGLRLGEVEELRLADLNLKARQLLIRQGKGLKDRVVYLTDTALAALNGYLAVRGEAASDHLCLFRHRPLSKDFVRERLRAARQRTGINVTPHQLRHTYATQLLNAGCPITTIQQLLGHHNLNTTLIYARVHDHTVADDYARAMSLIEAKQLPASDIPQPALSDTPQPKLLALLDGLHPLNAQQQAIVATLRQELLALAA